MEPSQVNINKRVIAVVKFLIDNKMVESQAHFCAKIGYDESSFVHCKNMLRPVPFLKLRDMSNVFNIHPDYLFKGKLPMFIGNKAPINSIEEVNGFSESDNIVRYFARNLSIDDTGHSHIVRFKGFDNKRHLIEFVKE